MRQQKSGASGCLVELLKFLAFFAALLGIASLIIIIYPSSSTSISSSEYPDLCAQIMDITENRFTYLKDYEAVDNPAEFRFDPGTEYLVVGWQAYKNPDKVSVGYGPLKKLKQRINTAEIIIVWDKDTDYVQTYYASTGAKAGQIRSDSVQLICFDRATNRVLLEEWIENPKKTVTANDRDFVISTGDIIKQIKTHFVS